MVDKKNNKPQAERVANRYPYSKPAQYEVEGLTVEIQILNLSRSGVQFASKVQLSYRDPVKIRWNDDKFGLLDPTTMLIAREVHKPENKEYQYFYGAQYFNLTPEIKKKLSALLQSLKETGREEVQKRVDKVTPGYIFQVIEQGEAFLRHAFESGDVPSYFENIIKETKDYERLSFTMNDDVSQCVQKLTTHIFHCNLFGMLAPFLIDKSELQSIYFLNIQVELMKIAETEKLTEQVSAKALDSKNEGREADKKAVQKMINETSNRLFYTKQGLLQSVVETFTSIDPEANEFKNSFGKIKAEYERLLEFANSSFPEEYLQKRRTEKPAEYSRAEAIMDIQLNDRKTNYFLITNIIVVVILVLGIVFYNIDAFQKKAAIKDEIRLNMTVLSMNRMGSQIDLVVPSEDWKKIPEVEQNNVFEKIIRYLQRDKQGTSCVLFDEKKTIIKILYEDMLPDLKNLQ